MQEQPRPFAAVASSQSSEKLPRAASGFNKPNHLNGKPEYSNTNLLHKSETQAMISRKKSSILSEVGANPIAEISSKPVPKRFIARPIKVSPNIPEVIWRKYFLLSSLNSLYFGWRLPSPDIFVRMAVLLNRTFEPYSKESTMMSIMTADWVKSGLETCSITFRLRMLFCKLYAKSFSRRSSKAAWRSVTGASIWPSPVSSKILSRNDENFEDESTLLAMLSCICFKTRGKSLKKQHAVRM